MLRLRLFVLLGALLLFGLEPLLGKLMLPDYGGSFQVWTTCLMWFQGALFVGYLYVHFIAPRLRWFHLVLALTPLAILPMQIRGEPDPESPITSIVITLTISAGLPFLILSSTSVLAQRWLAASRLAGSEEPYQLYAASNAGSLVALLAYPFVVEPFLPLSVQRWVWSGAYLVYVASAAAAYRAGAAAGGSTPTPEPGPETEPETDSSASDEDAPVGDPSPRHYLAWFLLSMLPSAFLMAVTNVLALDIGSMPLIWVVPLAIYLFTFVLVFGRRPVYPRILRRFWPEICALGVIYYAGGRGAINALTVPLHLFVLFTLCMVGHGELHRLRPAPRHLTKLYLAMGLGGWAGGVFVTLIAPLLFTSLVEYPLVVGALVVTLLVARREAFRKWLRVERPPLLVASGLFLAIALVAQVRLMVATREGVKTLDTHRNFYGLYRIREYEPEFEPLPGEPKAGWRVIVHGTTRHGAQRQVGPIEERGQPIGYYAPPGSPISHVLSWRRDGMTRKAAIVGLGAGGLSAYFGSGESLVFYELDPDNEAIANEHFTFMKDAKARGVSLKVVPGDARLSIGKDDYAADGTLDVLVIDAFSSDVIPTHLLTEEALALYASKLAPEGALVFHISNRFYELQPVVKATGASLGVPGFFKARSERDPDLGPDETPSIWYVFTEDEGLQARLLERGWTADRDAKLREVAPWTDDYADVLGPLFHGMFGD